MDGGPPAGTSVACAHVVFSTLICHVSHGCAHTLYVATLHHVHRRQNTNQTSLFFTDYICCNNYARSIRAYYTFSMIIQCRKTRRSDAQLAQVCQSDLVFLCDQSSSVSPHMQDYIPSPWSADTQTDAQRFALCESLAEL